MLMAPFLFFHQALPLIVAIEKWTKKRKLIRDIAVVHRFKSVDEDVPTVVSNL
jgi:hypothetical protein